MKHAVLARQASNENGGPTALARKVNRSPSEVSQWIRGDRPIPLACAALIESVSSVTRKQLFPDDWMLIWPELVSKPRRPTTQKEVAHG